MPDTPTLNFGWPRPLENADANTWADIQKACLDEQDTDVWAIKQTADAALPRAGGTMTGQLAAQAGSAGAPGLSFTGDTNTGLYSAAADRIGIAANGAAAGSFGANGWRGDTDPDASPSTTATGYLGWPINVLSGSRSLAMTDAGRTVMSNGLGAHVLTLPAESSVNFPLGTIIYFDGGGAISGNPNTPFTIVSNAAVRTHFGGSSVTGATRTVSVDGNGFLLKIRPDQWRVVGHYGVT